MGTTGSKPTDSKTEKIEQKSSLPDQEDKKEHPNMVNKKIIKRNEEEEIQIEITVPSEKEYKKWDENVKILEQSQFAFAPLSHKFKSLSYCGNAGGITINYQHFPFLLCDEIANRVQENNHRFLEAEIWYLLYAILDVSHIFHSHKQKVGDIRPENIFIDQYGTVKIATIYTWPSEIDNFAKTRFREETTYLSPEELKEICFGKLESECDEALAETFSVGLTCLDAIILGFSQELYGKKFNYEGLEKKIIYLRSLNEYSNELKKVIEFMCETDCNYRPTCQEIYEWISPFKHQINDLESFQCKPFKFNNQKEQRRSIIPSSMLKKASNNIVINSSNLNIKNNETIKENALLNHPPNGISEQQYFEENIKNNFSKAFNFGNFIAPNKIVENDKFEKTEHKIQPFISNNPSFKQDILFTNHEQIHSINQRDFHDGKNHIKNNFTPLITFNTNDKELFTTTEYKNHSNFEKNQNKIAFVNFEPHNLELKQEKHEIENKEHNMVSTNEYQIKEKEFFYEKNTEQLNESNEKHSNMSNIKEETEQKTINYVSKESEEENLHEKQIYVENDEFTPRRSKISFDKIEEQLKKSRQMFPS